LKLKDKEFCSILNYAIRSDNEQLLKPASFICRGINQLCVTRGKQLQQIKWPDTYISYRGGGFPKEHRSFFEKDKKYRAPMFIATSALKEVAFQLCHRAAQAGYEPILWYFKVHPDLRCLHVNYLAKTNCPGEEEFLFSASSVFTVEKNDWKENPTWEEPHEIYLKVAPDNLSHPDDLPSAPWC